MATNVFDHLLLVVSTKTFLFRKSQPIVIKLRTQIGDNIPRNRTVSDF